MKTTADTSENLNVEPNERKRRIAEDEKADKRRRLNSQPHSSPDLPNNDPWDDLFAELQQSLVNPTIEIEMGTDNSLLNFQGYSPAKLPTPETPTGFSEAELTVADDNPPDITKRNDSPLQSLTLFNSNNLQNNLTASHEENPQQLQNKLDNTDLPNCKPS